MRISILSKLYDNLCKDVNKRNQKVVHYITRSNTSRLQFNFLFVCSLVELQMKSFMIFIDKDLSDITNQPIQKLLLVTNEDNLLC